MKQRTGSKLGKEFDKAVYCPPAYFTSMQKYPHYQYILQSKIALIKYALLTECAIPISKQTKWQQQRNVKKYSEIIAFIQAHAHEGISLENVASATGYTVPYLARFFKQFTGITVMEYINKLRLERATFLMQTTSMKIIDISFEVGFPNVKSFRKVLRDEFNVTPQTYVETFKNSNK